LPPWGPSALVSGSDQSFWIADAADNRLLQVDIACNLLATISLDKLTTAPADLAVTQDALWVLDTSAQQPEIVHLSRVGSLLAQYPLAEQLASVAGLSGLALSPQEEVLVEQENGARLYRMRSASERTSDATLFAAASGYTFGAQSVQTFSGGLADDDPATGVIKTSDAEISVAVPNGLGGLHILGFAPDGSFYAVLEEVALRDTIVVDQRVHHYAPDGTLLGQARAPVQRQYAYVPHALTVGADGNVYFLATLPTALLIQKLIFVADLTPIIPDLTPITKTVFVTGAALSQPFVDPEATPPAPSVERTVQACTISRDTIMANADAFINNRITLSESNVNGVCSGRGKPRYLAGAGTYTSVPYDWGGKVSLATFNARMSEGRQAGDIDTAAVEACSVGVDCSGFIAQVWNVPAFDSTCCENVGTSKLTEYSTQLSSINELQRGDILNDTTSHVALFSHFGDNGFHSYEATTSWNVDRVYQGFRDWTWVANGGYRPYRLKDQYLCNTDTDDGRVLNLEQPLSGTINPATDVDVYTFSGTQGAAIEIFMTRTSSTLDSYLDLYGPNGNFVASDDDGAGDRNSVIRLALPTTGNYRIFAKSYKGGSTGGYTIKVSAPASTSCSGIAQSAHPYANNYDNTWTLTNPDSNATASRIRFSRIDTERGYDYVTVRDGNNNQIARYDGAQSALWSGTAPGRTVKVQLTTDGSVTQWGFCVDRIETVSSGSAPAAPSNPRAVALDSNRIQLSWTDNSNNESGFQVKDGNSVIASLGAGVTTHTVTGLSAGAYRCYTIAAYNNFGTSAWTTWACATTPTTGSGNLARNRSAFATSTESSSYPATRANDGSTSTRWSSRISSTLGDQWWWVDLGGQSYARVVIRWEAAYAASFFVGYSDNGQNFSGNWYSASSAGVTTHQLGTRSNRYVGILMRTRAPRMNNYSIWEVEVYRDGTLVAAAAGDDLPEVVSPPLSTSEVTVVRPPETTDAAPDPQSVTDQ
jgi:hypothetical protein